MVVCPAAVTRGLARCLLLEFQALHGVVDSVLDEGGVDLASLLAVGECHFDVILAHAERQRVDIRLLLVCHGYRCACG
jgi:hypothetical protein